MSWLVRAKWRAIAMILKCAPINRLAHMQLPRKRMSASVLLFDGAGQLLIVKPSYRDRWLIPGGGLERDEAPWQGAIREAEEEIGLHLEHSSLTLKAIDWQPADREYDESLHFVFHGGVLGEAEVAGIRIDGLEITSFSFAPPAQVPDLLEHHLAKRTRCCLDHPGPELLLLTGGQMSDTHLPASTTPAL